MHNGRKPLPRKERIMHTVWPSSTATLAETMDCHNCNTPQQSMQARTRQWGTRWRSDIEARHSLLQNTHDTTARKGHGARGVDGWARGTNVEITKANARTLGTGLADRGRHFGAAQSDLHKRCGLVGQTQFDRKKTHHTSWMPLGNFHGRASGGSVDGMRHTMVGGTVP